MRDIFRCYLPFKEEEYRELWQKCLFVFDTNAILDFYRISDESRDQYVNLLRRLSDRIWIPHQVGLEVVLGRHSVIRDLLANYSDARKMVDDLRSQIKKSVDSLNFRTHPSLDKQQIQNDLQKPFRELEARLNELQAAHPNYRSEDKVIETIQTLFNGKVGKPYDDAEMQKVVSIGEERRSKKIPPGYEDKEIGDFIFWNQTIEHVAKCSFHSVILVTSENSRDWWQKENEITIGPRPELKLEMFQKSGALFHMYKPNQFMKWANHYVNAELSSSTMEEVGNLEKSEKQIEYIDVAKSDLYDVISHRIKVGLDLKRLQGIEANLDLVNDEIHRLKEEINAVDLTENSMLAGRTQNELYVYIQSRLAKLAEAEDLYFKLLKVAKEERLRIEKDRDSQAYIAD